MSNKHQHRFVVVGGGPGGALMATYLGQAGYTVDVHEMRGDLRTAELITGRSINLALSHRGICALDGVGLAADVLDRAVPMRGRMIHAVSGKLTFQPYGRDASQAINSVSRGGLNVTLLDAAEACENVRLHFDSKCTGIDLKTGAVRFTDTRTSEVSTVEGAVVVGADGAFSAVRSQMQRLDRFDYRQDYLLHGYKELTIPAGPNGEFALEKNALHIWPRRSLMMIALPNADGSFTCTLFWPFEGPGSFETVKTEADALRFFQENFPDAVPLIPTLAADYVRNEIGSLATVRCNPWYHRDKVVLLGDACHAVVPFYGQGMNAAFEDAIVLSECLERHGPDWERAFGAYHTTRKADVDTLADMAIANFVEMRDHTGMRRFLMKKKLEKTLHRMFPSWYIPLYTMATFTRTSYVEAVKRAQRQDLIVRIVFGAVAVLLLIAILWGILRAW